MDANNYFKLMEQTGETTYKKIGEYLDKEIKEKNLREFINTFIKGRLSNKRRLRSMLVRGVWEVLRGGDWEKGTDVCVWAELWCVADYLTNDIFDNKRDKCKTKIEQDSNLFFIASTIVREISEKVLKNTAKKLNPKKEKEVIGLFSELVNNAYHHQWVDYTTKYKNQKIDELKNQLNHLFKKKYIDYEAGNCFGKICEITSIIAGGGKKEREILISYGNILSVALQIVNDTADILERNYDLRNKLITWPLLLIMIKTNKNIYNLSESEVKKLLIESGAFLQILEICKEYRKKLKNLLKSLKNSHILGGITTLLVYNKYFKKIK